MLWRCTSWLIVTLSLGTMLSAQAPRGSVRAARRVLILATDTASVPTVDRVVPATTAALGRLMSPAQLSVLSWRDSQGGLTPDFPRDSVFPLSDRVELAKQFNAALLGLRAEHRGANEIVLWPTLLWRGKQTSFSQDPIRGTSIEEIAERLARRIAADSTLERIGLPQSGCPTNVLYEFQVDRPAVFIEDSSLTVRPASGGSVGPLVTFFVDTLGRPEPASLRFLSRATDSTSQVVRDAFVHWRFVPARLGRCNVRQLVDVFVNR